MSQPPSDHHRPERHAHGSRRDRGCLHLGSQACGGELAPGDAMTLRVRHAGTLQVRGERLWLTFWLAAHDSSVRGGDHFVEPGQHVALRPRQAVVIEPSQCNGQVCRPAQFLWQPTPGPLGALRRGLASKLRALADHLAPTALLAQR